jgi:hypothetical protein
MPGVRSLISRACPRFADERERGGGGGRASRIKTMIKTKRRNSSTRRLDVRAPHRTAHTPHTAHSSRLDGGSPSHGSIRLQTAPHALTRPHCPHGSILTRYGSTNLHTARHGSRRLVTAPFGSIRLGANATPAPPRRLPLGSTAVTEGDLGSACASHLNEGCVGLSRLSRVGRGHRRACAGCGERMLSFLGCMPMGGSPALGPDGGARPPFDFEKGGL